MKKIILASIFPIVFFLCMYMIGNISNQTTAQWWNIIFLMLAYIVMVAGAKLFKVFSSSKNFITEHTLIYGIVYFACQCVTFVIMSLFSISASWIQVIGIILLAMYLLCALADLLYQRKLK